MTEIICPHCHHPIYDEDALLCHFCGESLHRVSDGVLGKMRYGRLRWILWTMLVLVILGFILWMI